VLGEREAASAERRRALFALTRQPAEAGTSALARARALLGGKNSDLIETATHDRTGTFP